MAYTFLDAVAATGQRISAFFQTLTIFLLDHTLRPAFSLFSGNFNIPLLEGPPPQQAAAGEEQQEHPRTELEQSQQQQPQPQHQLDVQDQNSVTTTPATTSQSQSKNQSEDASAANSDALPQASFLSLTPEQANSSKLPDTEPDMVRTSSATATLAAEQQPLKKIPIPNVIPALPLVAPAKENAAPVKAGSTVAASADSENKLTGDLERLSIATDAAAIAATGAVGSGDWVPATQQPSEITQDNNTTPAAAADGASDAEPRQLLKTNVLHGHGPSTSVGWNIVDSLPRAPVVRSPAVPINHELSQTSQLKEGFTDSAAQLEAELETPEEAAERAMHAGFMREALDMARLALKTNETPVGCVLVYKDRVIARGMNATNVSRNGTRHAELMAICALLSYSGDADLEPKNAQHQCNHDEPSVWGDIDPGDGHLFPYGQKLHPAPRVDRSVISECTLYVTVEPCVMCASLLRQLRIKKVYFGAVNDKFGGTGGVFRIHKNSPVSMASAPPSPAPQNGKGIARPALERRPVSALNIGTGGVEGQEPEPVGDENDESKQNETVGEQPGQDTTSLFEPELHGDGGNVEPGYEVEGGWGRDEAVTLLRQFYVQENGRAPVPRKKEGRAARLAAMMERDGHAGGPMADAPAVAKPEENGASVDGDAAAQEGEEKSEEKTEENSGNSSDA
ncbi:hypothetical protein B0H65DRAFT_13702 [Neurospora tetraspora]|uniref:CMP/dCMP-type deaminase domain-containing protein n=1 Tax=Neurospora tetraspora TaxID=94610 RepID=A0AAE0JMY2_9PEZI|nr:hypothetical protein B0H65DRAFT_13702 [Neurospora tetraspora]